MDQMQNRTSLGLELLELKGDTSFQKIDEEAFLPLPRILCRQWAMQEKPCATKFWDITGLIRLSLRVRRL